MTRRIAIAGWYGSDNLGDELILHALAGALRARGAEPVAVSIDSAHTRRDHGIDAITHRGPGQSSALRRALGDCDGMAIAGGIIQSETSPWNIPFHTSRLRAAVGAGCPMAAVGMGVGHVHGPLGRRLSRSSLRGVGRIVVRDAASAERLRRMGIADQVAVGADPAVALEPEPVEPGDTMCVILRPPNRPGLRTAAGKARRATRQRATLDRIARSIDEAAAATGLTPRLVALQASRDGPLHDHVAERLAAAPEVVTPSRRDVLSEVGRSRLVVTMRYHGAVAALLHSRPAVLLNYSPKMASLGAEAGGWAPLVGIGDLEAGRLAAAAEHAWSHHGNAGEKAAVALGELRGRLVVNDAALDELADVGT